MTIYLPIDITESDPPVQYLISSMRVDMQGAHEVVRLWSRGAMAGLLIMLPGDGAALAQALGLVDKPCPRCGRHHGHDAEAPHE